MPELEITRQAIAEIGVVTVVVILLFFLLRQVLNFLNEKEKRQHELEMTKEISEQKREDNDRKRLDNEAELRIFMGNMSDALSKVGNAIAESGNINEKHIESLNHLTSSMRALASSVNDRLTNQDATIKNAEENTRQIIERLSPLEKAWYDALTTFNNAVADMGELQKELRKHRSEDAQALQNQLTALSEVITRTTGEMLTLMREQAEKTKQVQPIQVEETANESP